MPRIRARPGVSSGISQGSYSVRTLTAAGTVDPDDDVVLCDAAAGAFSVSLPSPSLMRHKRIEIKLISPSESATVEPTSGTIDGETSLLLSIQYESISLVTDGASWYLV